MAKYKAIKKFINVFFFLIRHFFFELLTLPLPMMNSKKSVKVLLATVQPVCPFRQHN